MALLQQFQALSVHQGRVVHQMAELMAQELIFLLWYLQYQQVRWLAQQM